MELSDRILEVYREAVRAAAPPPDITIAQWAEEHRILGTSSRLAGPYRTARTPYWLEAMEALSPRSEVQQVVIMKGTQLGASEIALNVLGFHLDVLPSPVLCVQPSIEMARRFSTQRLGEMISLSPRLSSLITVPRGGTLPNTTMHKATLNGANLILASGNSAANLRSLPARIVLLDEVDAYPGDCDGEGDPVDIAMQRAESYGSSRKVLIISTPTERGLSRIERLYLATDQRKFHVPCPACANAILLEFAQLQDESGETIHRCPLCGAAIRERDKPEMLRYGCWRPTNSAGNASVRGYSLSQLYSPWTRWSELRARHAASEGVPERERVFANCALAETWAPPALEVPEAEALMARAEPYQEGTVPDGGAFLTCGCDVQADRIECEIVAWGANYESWSVDFQVLYGDITEPLIWQRLDALLGRTWPHSSGMPMMLQAVAIDSGFSPAEVTAFTRTRHGRRIYATKGASDGWGRSIWPRRCSWDRNKHMIYLVSADEAKTWVANRMRIDRPGAGFMHTPVSRERWWYDQMCAEKLVFQKGRRRWLNIDRARNEAFDARALAVCALHSRLLAGVDLNQWCEQFAALMAPPTAGQPPAEPTVHRSKWMMSGPTGW